MQPKKVVALKTGGIYTIEMLAKTNMNALGNIAYLFCGFDWYRSPNLIECLRAGINDYAAFFAPFSRLEPISKTVLASLSSQPGKAVQVKDLSGKLGEEQPAKVEKAVRILINKGWLIEGADEGEQVVLLLPEIARQIRWLSDYERFFLAEQPVLSCTSAAAPVWQQDLIETAAFILTEKPKLTNQRLMNKSALKRLLTRLNPAAAQGWESALLNNRYPVPLWMLLYLLQAVGALTEQVDGNARWLNLNVDKWLDFLRIPFHLRLLAAFLAYLNVVHRYAGFGGVRLALALIQESTYIKGHGVSPVSLYKRISQLDNLSNMAYGDYDRQEQYLSAWFMEPLRSLGLYASWEVSLPTPWAKQQERLRSLWYLTDLGKVAGRIVKARDKKAVEQHFSQYFGVIDEVMEGKLTNAGEGLVSSWEALLPPCLDNELILQNDMTFIVPQNAPPELIWLLSVFGSGENQQYVIIGKFQKETVVRALKAGIKLDNLQQAITAQSKSPPPGILLSMLEEWGASYGRAIVGKSMIVACDTSEDAAELAVQTRLAGVILGQVGLRTILIKEEGEAVVRKWLERKGRVPPPGVAGGAEIIEWLQNRDKKS
ncbi:MAG TPA: helicase-associated domain-containing protein [Methylomusa anaerophila]|uniref:Helicase XPB/Ssl2 N-terminal domain-containing protein n=1 Tax=Methylomusa anaerophila TaxID=1930071 RepID=A0A348AH00_9FIRM|nr:helicase-associated domain-containing protein [Methylomusa anaerophila]BBB90348.1 hypothetical protein MAMMFC1_00996 [Methylomusa anaerophila]HML89306.1 helicase-associated domain-containing protein [Methylomusa anaerophila]